VKRNVFLKYHCNYRDN